jgi:hypothetical protein
MSTQIASWQQVIIKGDTYAKTMIFRDEDGALITWDTAEIVVSPNGADDFSWTTGNGRFVNSAPGTYDIALTSSYTHDFTWESGTYRVSVTLGSAVYQCYVEGLIFAKSC